MKKRILSLFMVLAIVLSMMPGAMLTAFAEENRAAKQAGNSSDIMSPEIVLIGEGTDKDGKSAELYNFRTTLSSADGQTVKSVKSIDWSQYALTGVKVAQSNADGSAPDDSKYTVAELRDVNNNVNAESLQNIYYWVDLSKGNQYVKFTYKWNMVDVTVNAVDADGKEIADYTPQVLKYESGKKVTINAPYLTGYELISEDESAKTAKSAATITPSDVETENVVTFKYKKISGNLIYKAVTEDGKIIGTFSGGTLNNGEAPKKSAKYAPDIETYMLKNINSDGTVTSDGNTEAFDGTNNITVTYTYTQKKKNIAVCYVKYNSENPVDKSTLLDTDFDSYSNVATGQTLTITAPARAGFSLKNVDSYASTQNVFIENSTDVQYVYFFYEENSQSTGNISVNLVEKDTGKTLGSYTVSGVNGVKQTINAPALHGYTVDKNSVEIAPDEDSGDGLGVVKFTYTRNIWTVTVKLVDSKVNEEIPVSSNYVLSYDVVKGEKITIMSPSIHGYILDVGEEAVRTVHPAGNMTVTFKYVPLDQYMVNIIIKDMMDDGSGNTCEYMTRNETVKVGTASKTISLVNIPGYKITNVEAIKDGESYTDKVKKSDSSLVVDTSKAGYGSTIEIILTHTYNKLNVTVEAKFGSKVLGQYTIPLEKGVETQIFPPVVEGYTSEDEYKNFTPTDNNTTVTFTLVKNTGNVTVIIVDKDTQSELTRRDGGTINKGKKILLSEIAKSFPEIEFYEKSSETPVITAGSKDVKDDDIYDGSGDITVKCEYARKTRDLTVIKKDFDTKKEISGSRQTLKNLPVGKEYTFLGNVTVPEGYSELDINLKTYYVLDKDSQNVTFYYKSVNNEDYVSVTVKLIDNKTGDTFQTYIIPDMRKGVETKITAPEAYGYKLTEGQAETQAITPDGKNDVVEFRYDVMNPKTLTVKLINNTDNTEMSAPENYILTYTVKPGDELTITAPSMSKYNLVSAVLDGNKQYNNNVASIKYDDMSENGSTLLFTYCPVAEAEFVTHTLKLVIDTDGSSSTLYTHDKIIRKGDVEQIIYSGDDVQYTVPGYTFDYIEYMLDGKAVTAEKITNQVNAVIIYHFAEDAATITVRMVDKDGNPVHTENILTGYHKGETVKVIAPYVEGMVLADEFVKTVEIKNAGNTDVTFKYADAGKVTLTLREKDGDIIKVISTNEATTYTAGKGELDLSANGWIYSSDDTSNVFNENDQLKIDNFEDDVNYNIYYIKQTRDVTFVAVDKDLLGDKNVTDATVEMIIKMKTENAAARVGESYTAVAGSIDGYNLKDAVSKSYDVTADDKPLYVYFLYEKKSEETVTVNYYFGNKDNKEKLLNYYWLNASADEMVTVNAPKELEKGKYKLSDGQNSFIVINVVKGENTVDFYYTANFWTVTEKISVDGNNAEYTEYEIIKNNIINMYPPNKTGYTLMGISGIDSGSENEFPESYKNNKLSFVPKSDTTVTYHYAKKVTVTVEYRYNGYKLKESEIVNANKGYVSMIEIPEFGEYTASTYSYTDGTEKKVENASIPENGISVAPDSDTGIVTINYSRTDGTVILPGKDGEIDAPAHDKDNVTVKPDGDAGNISAPDKDGNVTVDDENGATVTRPDPDDAAGNKKEDIKVPDGTVIKPDGTIILPDTGNGDNGDDNNGNGSNGNDNNGDNDNDDDYDSGVNGGEIKPDDKLPESVPAGYAVVIYEPNGGIGNLVKQIVNIQNAAASENMFTGADGKVFMNWNTAYSGMKGISYAPGDKILFAEGSNTITLYAQWMIVLPGKDGEIDEPNDKDNVFVVPDKGENGKDNSKIDESTGDVTLPDGGSVIYPDGTIVDAPDDSVVHPDGSIDFPDSDKNGSITDKDGNETPVPGGSKVDADGVVTYRYTIRFSGIDRDDEYVMVKSGEPYTYTAPEIDGYNVDKDNVTWNGGDRFNENKDFIIIFTYTKSSSNNGSGNGSGGGSGNGSGGGSGSGSGGGSGSGSGGGSGGGSAIVTKYTIAASAGNGGSITPSGSISVNSESDTTFTITADNGYHIKEVLVDGETVGSVSTYTFKSVKSNHTIYAAFEEGNSASVDNVADPDHTGVSGWLCVNDHNAYVQGFGRSVFGAEHNLTRAQTAQMFYNLLINKEVEITVSFDDIPEGKWYFDAVSTLASMGIVDGIGNGLYRPDRNITRAEFTAISTRFAKAVNVDMENPFTDVLETKWYYNYIMTAVSYGWINGVGNGLFMPMADISRAEAVTIVNRMLARSADRDYIDNSEEIEQFIDVNKSDWYYYQIMEAANGHRHYYNTDGSEIWKSLKK